jgi:type III restriction enzyme
VEEYTSLYRQEYGQDATDIDSVHSGYFAKTTSGDYTDNQRTMATNKEIYDKILRDKSTLLAQDEPLEFIFSHSALGVGWDNPNVFTICTLSNLDAPNLSFFFGFSSSAAVSALSSPTLIF